MALKLKHTRKKVIEPVAGQQAPQSTGGVPKPRNNHWCHRDGRTPWANCAVERSRAALALAPGWHEQLRRLETDSCRSIAGLLEVQPPCLQCSLSGPRADSCVI